MRAKNKILSISNPQIYEMEIPYLTFKIDFSWLGRNIRTIFKKFDAITSKFLLKEEHT